jgi:hypothetical protein
MINKKLIIAFLCSFFLTALNGMQPVKEWTILIYIAADNDLDIFADRNIKQMIKVGPSQYVNIILCVNTSEKKYKIKTSKIVIVEKNNAKILKRETQAQYTDSGNQQTLIDFCTYALEKYPSHKTALIFWDHGTGALSPFSRRNLPTSDMFLFDAEQVAPSSTHYLDNISLLQKSTPPVKAICFDDSTGNFLTEKKIITALRKVCKGSLKNKKFDLIGFDACLMAMIETAFFLKEFANIMVASQEVELGDGWDYKKVLTPFLFKDLSPCEFGKHIVESYAKTYSFIDDFTLSCVDLTKIEPLEKNIQQLARFFNHQCSTKNNSCAFDLIKASRYRHTCTHFDEPDFIDLQHFYKNLLQNTLNISHPSPNFMIPEISDLKALLESGIKLMRQATITNATGSYFPHAKGLSIYFPEHSIHRSYKNNSFATNSFWLPFLKTYFS